MKFWLSVCAGLTLASCSTPGHLGPGTVDLFNGVDLTGWVNVQCAPDTWTVRDGMIISSGKPTGVLRTERMYQNFILELEWRHMQPQGNAGLFIWSDPITAKGQPFTRSIEVQILDGRNTENYTSDGDVFAIHGATMTPDRPHPNGWMRCLPKERRSHPSPEWNRYRITCKNGKIKLSVNGKVVSGGYDISPRMGYICLESEGSEVHFRNIVIRELDAEGIMLQPEMVAQEARNFFSIYSGVDLSGWEGDGGGWTSADWRLKADPQSSNLSTEATYRDFDMIVDFKWNSKEQSREKNSFQGLLEAASTAARPSLDHARLLVTPIATEDSKWHRLNITVEGDLVRIWMDDKFLTEFKRERAPRNGPIILSSPGAPVTFANLYVRRFRNR
jgi:3-keto-disaccharide hydrolase